MRERIRGSRKLFGLKSLGFGYFSRQVAKTLSSEEKNNAFLIRPLRLCVFAGDFPVSGCGSAARTAKLFLVIAFPPHIGKESALVALG
jgi:hypothetical protein